MTRHPIRLETSTASPNRQVPALFPDRLALVPTASPKADPSDGHHDILSSLHPWSGMRV